MATNQILVVDDEVGIRELLSEILEDEGYQVKLAENASQARVQRMETRPDLVLLDIWMPDTDGITLLKEWASNGLLTMPVVMMSGHGTIDTAVEATRIGAVDFLEKPIAMQKLLSTVGRALKRGTAQSQQQLSLASLGKSPQIAELKKRMDHIANLNLPLLLVGEVGCGADICARFLHQPNTQWITPENYAQLVDAPLDLLQQAQDGLLFLTEIGELSKQEQKGLMMLVSKLGKYNVRLVCATSKPLPELVGQGLFDASLYQALSALTLSVPSLREHREDIPDLARLMLSRCVEAGEAPLREFSTSALNALRNYSWPGNLIQLENAVKTLALTSLEEQISLDEVNRVLSQFDIEPQVADHALPLDVGLREARDAFERVYFRHHINKERGNMSRIAERVGLERTHLYRKLKQLGIKMGKRNHEQ
jgi:DNA-binding NtrC family response regulator